MLQVSPVSLAQLVAISSLPFMAKHGIFPWEITGRRVNRQTLASVFNAHSRVPQFLTCTACCHLEQPHHSAGKPQTQQSLTCQGLWLGWSQRLSVTHPTKSQVRCYGWRLPLGALWAQFTVPLGTGLHINNVDGEQSLPAWLEKICTWTDVVPPRQAPGSRPLCVWSAWCSFAPTAGAGATATACLPAAHNRMGP